MSDTVRAAVDAAIENGCKTGYAGEFSPPLVEVLRALADGIDALGSAVQTAQPAKTSKQAG